MVVRVGKWEISTNPSESSRTSRGAVRRMEPAEPEALPEEAELEQIAGEFIARHVLEKDPVLFEG